jgi:hypothetical protein
MAEEYPLYRYLSFKEEQPYRRYAQHEGTKDTRQNNSSDNSNPSPPTHGSYGLYYSIPIGNQKERRFFPETCIVVCTVKVKRTCRFIIVNTILLYARTGSVFPGTIPATFLLLCANHATSRGHNKYKVPTIHV